MDSGRRLVQDQNISHKGRRIGGGLAEISAKAENPAPRKPAAIGAGNATTTARNHHLTKVADGFDAVIGKCAVDLEVEAVHRLRTGSRRVQATVETLLRQSGAARRSFEKSAKLWLRSLRNIRRAAGPVRDLDVHRKLLEETTARRAKQASAAAQMENAERLTGLGKRLDDWLKENRDAGAETLRRKIKKTRAKLEQRRGAFQSALAGAPDFPVKRRRSPGLIALEDFVRVTDRMPVLDSGNLHDFRKLIKKARYVAESGAERSSQTIASALKSVQDAIGEWHDWQCLAAEARTALGKEGEELTAWLEVQAEEFLAAALSTSERVRGQLLGEWLAAKSEPRAGKTSSTQRKLPARASQAQRFRGHGPISGAA